MREADPDYLIIAPCGYGLERTRRELPILQAYPGWSQLRAVKMGRVALADGNKYFNRSGTTIVQTVEMIAEILHGYCGDARGHEVGWEAYIAPTETIGVGSERS